MEGRRRGKKEEGNTVPEILPLEAREPGVITSHVALSNYFWLLCLFLHPNGGDKGILFMGYCYDSLN